MRRHWLLSVGLCAVSVLAARGWVVRPAKAATLTHVAVLAGFDPGAELTCAQNRYLNSQANHWRQCMLKH